LALARPWQYVLSSVVNQGETHMSIKSIVIAAALGASTLVGIGAASAAPYRGEARQEQRLDNRIGRTEAREGRFERRTGRVDQRREGRLHRMERRDGRMHRGNRR
jgi:hypothetical protein